MPLSVVIPVYNEGEAVLPHLRAILDVLDGGEFEIGIVYDMPEDITVPVIRDLGDPRVIPILNTYGRGPAHAIRFGIDHATHRVVIVTMADASDDPTQIPLLADLIEEGNVVAAASRYMEGGDQVGGPKLKALMSRTAGVSLYHLARVGTKDATNSFKGYDRDFVRSVGVNSRNGFEIGIELVAKARRHRLPVAEIPTTWHDRTEGESRFDVVGWTPHYLKWYFHAFGPALDGTKETTGGSM